MGYHQNLMLLRNPIEPRANGFGDRTANACIHLIENKGMAVIARRQHHFQCQHEPRQFATRGNFRDRPLRCSRVGLGNKPDLIAPLGSNLLGRFNRNAKRRAIQFQRQKFAIHSLGQAERGCMPSRTELSGRIV